MKLSIVISLIAVLNITANVYSQSKKISINARDVQLGELFREIENKTDFAFFYNAQYTELSKRVTAEIEEERIDIVLSQLLADTHLDFRILNDNFIVIIPRESDQTLTITGTITDIFGRPMPGVNIIQKGTSKGVITDIDGTYLIEIEREIVSNESTLVFSCIGYTSQEMQVSNESRIDIILHEDTYGLDAVIITGYGIQKKSNLTGAIISIPGKQLAGASVSGVDQALQGRAAGVLVTSETGAPGSDVIIRVRGISSINGAIPLFIIDGVPSTSEAISSLNPDDIQSMEILKDAASSAIYGASGGNGVVLISTKQGENSSLSAELNYYFGFQNPYKKLDMCNSQEFLELYSRIAPSNHPWPADTFVYFPDVDYQDELFKNAPIHNINLAISGGNEFSTYRFSTSYFYQDGVIPNSKYDRFTCRLNSNHQIKKIINIGQNLTLINEKYSGYRTYQYNHGYESPVVHALQMHPIVEPYDENGNWGHSPISGVVNPFVDVDILDRELPEYRAMGDINLSIDLMKGLVYKTIFGGGIDFLWSKEFSPEYNYDASHSRTSSLLRRENERNFNWSWQHTLTYNFTYGKHNFTLLAGYEASYSLNENVIGSRSDLINETREMQYFDASLSADNIVLNGRGEEVASGAGFGRLIYDFKSKYLFTINLRKDYSSKFSSRNRYGYFPSVSAGWKFSEEPFIKRLGILSFGKIRAGWGRLGNSNLDPYIYYARVQTENVYGYALNNGTTPIAGSAPHGIANDNITWEALEDINAGLDLTFWENRISFTTDIFRKVNRGMIIEVPTPDLAGVYQENADHEGGSTQLVDNVGNVENRGIELSLGFKNSGSRFKHSVSTNFTYIQNKVRDLNGDSIIGDESFYTFNNLTLTTEGEPMGCLYGYVSDGLFRPSDAEMIDGELVVTNQPYHTTSAGRIIYAQPNAQPGDMRFKDLNGDGNITSDDRTIIGNPHPKYLLGFLYELKYGQFDFSIFWQGTFGHEYFRANKVWLYNMDGTYNWHTDMLDSYTDENTDADLFRLDNRDANRNLRPSDWYVEQAGYLRLKNIQLGYTLPFNITNRVGISKSHVYIGARDLLTFTKYEGLDPEIVSNADPLEEGVDVSTYPRPRVFIIGFDVCF